MKQDWTQSGKFKLTTAELLLYSGHARGPQCAAHTRSWFHDFKKVFKLAGSQIIPDCSATFQTTHCRIKVRNIQYYASTNEADDSTKGTFYNTLQNLILSQGERDLTVVMGDLNPKTGSENRGYEQTMGQHGLGEMNEKGELLADFVQTTGLS